MGSYNNGLVNALRLITILIVLSTVSLIGFKTIHGSHALSPAPLASTTTGCQPCPTGTSCLDPSTIPNRSAGYHSVSVWVAANQNSANQSFNGTGATCDTPTTFQQSAQNFGLIMFPTNKAWTTTANGYPTSTIIDSLRNSSNPSLKFIVYLNGCCAMGFDPMYQSNSYAESSYAHSANPGTTATRLFSSGFNSAFMNRDQGTEWPNSRVSLCQAWMTQTHAEGCYYDSYDYSWFIQNHLTGTANSAHVPAIDPATGVAWTQAKYDSDGAAILRIAKTTTTTHTGGTPIIAINGLRNGSYFVNSNQGGAAGSSVATMMQYSDMGMAEQFLVDNQSGAYDTGQAWLNDIALEQWLANTGKSFIPTVKSWDIDPATQTLASKTQLLYYATATTLIGGNSNTYLNFENDHSAFGGTEFYKAWDTDIGTPSGAGAAIAGSPYCWTRPFSKGFVVINANAAGGANCSFSLPSGSYADICQNDDGNNSSTCCVTGASSCPAVVSGTVTLTPGSGNLYQSLATPTVTLTAPGAGSTISGSTTVSASASISSGSISGMTIRDGGITIASCSSSPCSIAWDTTTIANGSHSLTATAVSNSGVSATSAARTVTVSNASSTVKPTVSFTTPTPGTVSASISISATADVTAGNTIQQIVLAAGSKVLNTCSAAAISATCSVAWDTTTVANGPITLTATATASNGKTNTAADAVTVVNAPTVPSDLHPTSITTNSITIAWTASTESGLSNGQIGYIVTNTVTNQSHAVAGGVTTFVDSGLAPGTTYDYHVAASDGTNTSAASKSITPVTATLNCANPAAPTGLASTDITAITAKINWNTVAGTVSRSDGSACPIDHYVIQRTGGASNSNVTTTTTSLSDTNLVSSTTYAYDVLAVTIDHTAGADAKLNVTTASAADSTPPSLPANLVGVAASSSQINLTWTASTDAESGIASYRIARDGSTIGDSATTSFGDSGLEAGRSYSYTVTAVNGAGLTAVSAAQSVSTLHDTAPSGSATTKDSPATQIIPILVGTVSVGSSSDNGSIKTTAYNPTAKNAPSADPVAHIAKSKSKTINAQLSGQKQLALSTGGILGMLLIIGGLIELSVFKNLSPAMLKLPGYGSARKHVMPETTVINDSRPTVIRPTEQTHEETDSSQKSDNGKPT